MLCQLPLKQLFLASIMFNYICLIVIILNTVKFENTLDFEFFLEWCRSNSYFEEFYPQWHFGNISEHTPGILIQNVIFKHNKY